MFSLFISKAKRRLGDHFAKYGTFVDSMNIEFSNFLCLSASLPLQSPISFCPSDPLHSVQFKTCFTNFFDFCWKVFNQNSQLSNSTDIGRPISPLSLLFRECHQQGKHNWKGTARIDHWEALELMWIRKLIHEWAKQGQWHKSGKWWEGTIYTCCVVEDVKDLKENMEGKCTTILVISISVLQQGHKPILDRFMEK